MAALLILCFGLWTIGLRTGRLRWFAAAGLALGVTCLFRPDWILLPAFLLVGALAVMRSRRRAIVASGVLVACAFLVILPWGLRNLAVNGRFNVTSHAGGMALYQSIGQFPNPYGIVFDDGRMYAEVRASGFESLDDPGADAWFKRRFMAIVRENPALLAEQAARRIPLGIMPLYRWGYDNPRYRGHGFYDYARQGLSPEQAILRHPGSLLAAYWDRLLFGVIALGLFVSSCALAADRRLRGWGLVLFLPYLYVFLSHLPVILGARLLLPAVFGQLIALAVWIERFVFHGVVEIEES
jgi:4-amino-4-deoxy-L-arabinose transferase-like glycosyltransferase